MDQICYPKIIDKNDTSSSCNWLPLETIELIRNHKTDIILSILESDKMVVHYYPIKSNAYHIQVKFNKFAAIIISEMINKLRDLTRKILFSKGTTHANSGGYIWEAFILEEDLEDSIENIDSILNKLKEVSSITWKQV
ncbi:MAG: hypothetical protein OEZ01_07580 [Candidatus Heimdallarchaeota archaeon]|nr:hypothetical protein [Candidatus Heimdallarchaeota archaeon]MDH5645852.1 hypothetical protein [Candidatus Heimdallarchaeota archaeon]